MTRWSRRALLAFMLTAAPVPLAARPSAADAAAVALHAGNASNAVVLATQALDDQRLTAHDRARVLVQRALAHEALGEHDGALIDLTEAIDGHALSRPEQARAFYDRGVTLDEIARIDDAIGDYSAAILIEPRFAAALNNRANAYRRQGKAQAAHSDYLASIAAENPHPEYPDYGLGQLAEAAGDADAARRYYRAALAAEPQFALAAARLAALGDTPPPAPAPADTTGPIHLKPPPAAIDAGDPAAAPVQLRPPGPKRSDRPAAAAAQAPQPAAAAKATIQLGAWRSQGDAANAWSRIARATGDLLTGMAPQILSVDLPGKGRYYRLRTGPATDAQALCAALAAKGLSCIVVKD